MASGNADVILPQTQGPALMTCITANIPATATTVMLLAPCTTITVITTLESSILYVQYNGTAATTSGSGIRLDPGRAYSYWGVPIQTISIIGAAASGTYSVFGH